MPLRNNVTFKVSMPFDPKRHPVGEEVATYLASALETRSGLHASIDNWRDSGYELACVINSKELHFAFTHVDDSRFHFYGQVASYVGWFRRLFGYQDEVEQRTLILALHDMLINDPVFSEVYWHVAWYDEADLAKQP